MPLIADRYEPTGNAAWGGMGQVNECIDKNLDRRVMLKRVFRLSDMPRLLDEQKALIKLRSKHVVQLLDVVKFDWRGQEITCLVLEHIEGSDLDKLKFIPNLEYQKLLWQIASGLSDIHRTGVIHRDVKPQNIRQDKFGVVKIFDFGLARQIGVDDKTRSITGTQGYMAPELYGSSTISFSTAVDTFAFGRTALALLGAEPRPEPPKAVAKGLVLSSFKTLNPLVAETIERCLELSPGARPAMAEVASLLARDLVRDRHHARIVQDGRAFELNAKKRGVQISSSAGSIRIQYDGTKFFIAAVTGDVYLNNMKAAVGAEMLSSCVITMGAVGNSRAFLTFDISNPEIAA